ncbi:MAG: hypothetical protein RSE00_03170 [Clostridia bacterium]
MYTEHFRVTYPKEYEKFISIVFNDGNEYLCRILINLHSDKTFKNYIAFAKEIYIKDDFKSISDKVEVMEVKRDCYFYYIEDEELEDNIIYITKKVLNIQTESEKIFEAEIANNKMIGVSNDFIRRAIGHNGKRTPYELHGVLIPNS